MDIDWQTVVALLALLFSVYTFRRTHNLAEKQADLIEDQKRLNQLWLAKEETEAENTKGADVSANLIRLGKGARVKIFNKGKSEARNIRILDVEQCAVLVKTDAESKFPLERLEAQQGVDLIASIHLGSPSKVPLTLAWDDNRGANHTKTVYLTT